MCGIAGAFVVQASAAHPVIAMTRAMVHRGPDDGGVEKFSLQSGVLGLGQRRLSILDLSAAGHQPMQHPDTGDWIVFNGEIYNYPLIRRELESCGSRFRSRCDTEVVLHAFAQWGTECFDRLHGMFAAGVYDRSRQRLILARDPLGIKPLYYANSASGFVFASELRALVASNLVGRQVDRRALAGLLAYGAVQQPFTMYSEAKLLEPGNWVAVDLTRPADARQTLSLNRFWNFPPPRRAVNYPETLETVRGLLTDAVRSHLLSDVPLGVFLSSGLDSTVLATLSSRLSETIQTFTVGLRQNSEIDESPMAAETARRLGTEHHQIELAESDVLIQTQRYLEAIDQPTLDGLNTYIIAGAVRAQGIKVALSGLGGDELFGGYPSFSQVPRFARWLRRAAAVPAALRREVAGLAMIGGSKAQRQKARELATTCPTVRDLYFRRRRLFSDLEMANFGVSHAALHLDSNFLMPESEPDLALDDRDAEAEISVLESRFYMGNMLLRDADVFGMAHGLEIRVPFLHRPLIDAVYALPGSWRTPRRLQNKPMLADAMGSQLSPVLRSFPKRGFRLPQADWMAELLRPQFEHLIDRVAVSGLMNPSAVRMVWRDFLNDRTGPTWSRAWTLGVLGAWLDANRGSH